MGHEITKSDVFGETRKNGQKASHGLGVEIPEGLTAEEGFKKIGLGWPTELVPVTVEYKGHKITDPDHMMHVRCDDNTSLGVVGKDYKPVSNIYLAQFADALVGADRAVKLETAGSLRGGKRVYCSVKLPRDIEVTDQDILEMYVIGSNAHDGTAAFQWYGSSIRPVCANTLGWSEGSSKGMIKFQHTGDIAIKVEMAQAALGILAKRSKAFEIEVKSLAKMKLSKDKAQAYFEACYDATFGKISAEWSEKEQVRRQEHKNEQVKHWMELLDHEYQSLKGIKGSAWAAYNAYSQWCDHERGRFKATKDSDARLHSNLFGISFSDKRKAFHKALQIV